MCDFHRIRLSSCSRNRNDRRKGGWFRPPPCGCRVSPSLASELTRLAPEPAVIAWFSRQHSADLYLTAVSEAELRAGAAILPSGRCRDRLAAAMREDFTGRVLPFDSASAKAYAALAASRRSVGRPVLEADCQIAAIARARDAAVAIRNGADFEHCAIAVIDPRAHDRASP